MRHLTLITGSDNPYSTLRSFSWPQGCNAIICGGDNSRTSNCLGDEVEDAVKERGITLDGVSPKSGCGVDADGKWWQWGKGDDNGGDR